MAKEAQWPPKISRAKGLLHTQIANAVGIAVLGAVFFAFHDAGAERLALLAALSVVAAALFGCCGCLVLRMRAA